MDPNILVDRDIFNILVLALFGLFLACFALLERFLSYRKLYKERGKKLDLLCEYLNEFPQNDALLAKLTPLAEEYRRACRAQIESVQQDGLLQKAVSNLRMGNVAEEAIASAVKDTTESFANTVRVAKDNFWSNVEVAQRARIAMVNAGYPTSAQASFSRIASDKPFSYRDFLAENARTPENE